MTHAPEENLGRRRFLLYRDKAVEHALERIRRAPDAGWESLSPEERIGLKRALGEIWESCDRDHWDQYCFSTLTKLDILTLVALVNEMLERHDHTCGSRKEIEDILLSYIRDQFPH